MDLREAEPPSYDSAMQKLSKSCSMRRKVQVLCTCSVLGIVVFLCVAFLCIPSPIFNLHDQKDSPTPAYDSLEGPSPIPSECPSCPTPPDYPTPRPCDPEGPTTPSECPSCPTLPDYPTPRPCDPCLPCEVADSTTQDRISFLERCCESRSTYYSDCLVAPSPDSETFIDWVYLCCRYGTDCYIS